MSERRHLRLVHAAKRAQAAPTREDEVPWLVVVLVFLLVLVILWDE